MMNNSFLKKNLTTLMSIAFVSLLSAQEASVSKQINQIKRNAQYVYSEATMENESDAMTTAYGLLVVQVQEYLATDRKLNLEKNALNRVVKEKSESMSMMRGTLHRVFVYVRKSDVEGSIGASTGTSPQRTPVEKTQPDPEENAVSEAPPASGEALKPAQQTEVSTPQATVGQVLPHLAGWQKKVIDSMLACTDMKTLQNKLSRMKSEYKVKRYGAPEQCPSQDRVFWVIFDEGDGVITVLCPDNERLVDYRTNQDVSLSQYKGMYAIWFQLSN